MSTVIWPDESTDLFWVGPAIVVVLSFILWRVGQLVTTRVSFDILENCHAECMKESVKNNWTNMAVTAALLLTLVAAMLQMDPIEPVAFELDGALLVHIQQTYSTLCIAAIWCNLLSILYCIIYLSYVDPLREIDVMKFLLMFPDSLGDPAIWLAEGCIFMWLAIGSWVFGTYGAHQLVTAMYFFVMFCGLFAFQAKTRGAFNPHDLDFSWTQMDPTTWEHGYLTRNIRKSKGTTEQVKKIGRYILNAGTSGPSPVGAP